MSIRHLQKNISMKKTPTMSSECADRQLMLIAPSVLIHRFSLNHLTTSRSLSRHFHSSPQFWCLPSHFLLHKAACILAYFDAVIGSCLVRRADLSWNFGSILYFILLALHSQQWISSTPAFAPRRSMCQHLSVHVEHHFIYLAELVGARQYRLHQVKRMLPTYSVEKFLMTLS